jgi:hypothetical protein
VANLYGGYKTSKEYADAIKRVESSGGNFQNKAAAMAFKSANPGLFGGSNNGGSTGSKSATYTINDFLKLNPDYSSRFDPTTKTAFISNTKTGKEISFGLGQGQQYGLGGIQGGSHAISDPGKLIASLSGPGTFESPYEENIGRTLTAIQDRTPFNYDPSKDVGLQSAQTSAMDAVSRAAARRGMLYSDSSRSQMGKAALELVPQFEQLAYNRYAGEGSDLYNQLAALQGAENTDYGRYRDTVGDQRYSQEFAYQQARDSIGDQWKQREFDETVRQFGLQYALSKLEADRGYEINKGQLAISRSNAARGGGGGGGTTKDILSSAIPTAYKYFDSLPTDRKEDSDGNVTPGVGLKTKAALKNQFNNELSYYLNSPNPYQLFQQRKNEYFKMMPDTAGYLVNALENALGQLSR